MTKSSFGNGCGRVEDPARNSAHQSIDMRNHARPITIGILPRLFALALCASAAFAQTAASLSPSPNLQFFDTSSGIGLPCVNCTLSTFAAGTNTPLKTYTDYTATTQNPVVITLSSLGYSTSGLWISASCYKFVLKNALGSTIWTQDHTCDNAQLLKAALATASGAGLVGFRYPGSSTTRTVQSKLQEFGPSVKDFGATGDGSTNDTAALIASIGSISSTIAPLWAPCGNYRFSLTLPISVRVVLQGGGPGGGAPGVFPCTTFTKTADVVGIKINSGATFTKLAGFRLTSTASTGTSSGIQVGTDNDGSPNGAGEVRLQELVVDSQKGHGIDVQNGNVGVMDQVFTNANGIDGVHISSDVSQNANAWRLYSVSSIGNARDGINLDIASSTVAFGFNTEGNGRYGIYGNRPYMNLQGYSESNTSDNEHLTSSCFDCFMVVRDVQNKLSQGSTLFSYVYNQAGNGTAPSLDGLTGRFGLHGMLSLPLIKPTYGPTVTINNNLGNSFLITATDATPFTVSAPSQTVYEGQIQICIANASGGNLGMVTWPASYTMGGWISPLDGFTRCINFELNVATTQWLETLRSVRDIGASPQQSDYERSLSSNNYIHTGLTGTGSDAVFTYPNISVDATWRTTCQTQTTTAGSASTITLNIQALGGARVFSAPATMSMASTLSTASVSAFEIIPAGTSGRTMIAQWTRNTASDGAFAINCIFERVQ